ncbi:hypothetical protein LRAMOSA11200 [Lichtheimia ramosa]|uniref:Mannosyltransferase n=1 Tax=Lichtheimia ramosa TaxID=688394 RepID=A0A077WTT5_9FUNG|nr:hypothetical protein LRAMOSA11200 [Lichtheimia ramosa]
MNQALTCKKQLLPWRFFTLFLAILPGVVEAAEAADFGSILTSGIQDISAVAAIFGTDLVEKKCNMTLRGLQYPVFATIGMFGSLGYAKWALQTILPVHISMRLFTPEEEQLSFECNIWMFVFSNYRRWLDNAGSTKILKAWNFYTGDIANVYRRLGLSLIKETYSEPIISAVAASSLAIITSFFGLIAFVPQFLEIGLSWGPLLRFPTSPGVKTISATGFWVAIMFTGVLVAGAFALVAGYVGSFQTVRMGSANASIIWLTVELCLMVLRLLLWCLIPKFLHLGSIRIRLEDPAPFKSLCYERKLKEDETKVALFAHGASVQSIKEFNNITGLRRHDDNTFITAKSGQEHEYLVCTARPTNEKRGLYGRRILHNVPIGDPELIASPSSSDVAIGEHPAVDILIHDDKLGDEFFPQPDHYWLDVIPTVQQWDDILRGWMGDIGTFESLLGLQYHPLTKVHLRSWARFAFSHRTPWETAVQNAGRLSPGGEMVM